MSQVIVSYLGLDGGGRKGWRVSELSRREAGREWTGGRSDRAKVGRNMFCSKIG